MLRLLPRSLSVFLRFEKKKRKKPNFFLLKHNLFHFCITILITKDYLKNTSY